MNEFNLNEKEKKILLELARKSIENKLKGEKEPFPEVETENLNVETGAFVTLKKNGVLRGCIGYIKGIKPLWEAIVDLAKESAFHDPRFPAVKLDEIKDIRIEISVLTPLRKIDNINEIQVGKHGLFIKRGFYQGLLLPQVATEENWDLQTFLDNTCLKAGLYPGCWKDEKTEIYIFEALIFSED
ncbi:MAG TPA: AmmeMemoRadiSam system protein A [Candidatus Hydrothermia bacterium]|nr:AmmeMemoRadiSam system protein A [Candidatus Hydrothermae bacterium]MDD3649397.1 AmmeMemoRadiSam system protein A [Candidatus Hydrothermia bacterium]MDD5572531.1 AmmeMemoRadiSam system protein A [Candidatus Hydrothermia bacterium]HOK22885.1 AmmeMemoRadiSam system protein A [Candidatus Hydrothermia bacterium]HOL23594.1 AmmeMemoRadiSam system protein A [Candidatus Hydrothermia bacterium]